MKVNDRKRLKTQVSMITGCFIENPIAIILARSQKLLRQVYNKPNKHIYNSKLIRNIISAMDKDRKLINKTNTHYYRLISIIYNIKALSYRQLGEYQLALECYQQAHMMDISGNLSIIEKCRTLLNKSLILLEICKQTKYQQNNNKINNLFYYEEAFFIIDQSLKHISNMQISNFKNNYMPNLPQKNKFCEVLVLNFQVIAQQAKQNQQNRQANALYRKAYALAIRILGSKHSLTLLLKQIAIQHINNYIHSNKQNIRKAKTPISDTIQKANIDQQINNNKKTQLKSFSIKSKRNRLRKNRINNLSQQKNYIQFNKSLSILRFPSQQKFPKIYHNAGKLIKQGYLLSLVQPQYAQQKMCNNDKKMNHSNILNYIKQQKRSRSTQSMTGVKRKQNRKNIQNSKKIIQKSQQALQENNCQLI